MPESDRPFSSILMAVLLIVGGVITLAAGLGYMDSSDVSSIVAALDIVAGAAIIIGGICCLIGRPNLWKIVLGTVCVEAIAGIGMMTVTLVGGIVLILISAWFVWWLHTRSIRGWFGV
ncbi:MAG: hypothetical protein Q4Q58_05440 [Thermoplasmata archaeon]|nr:hypothetical protein [Thermoplasmata archaeon]